MMSLLIKKTIFSIFITSFIFPNYNSDLKESIEYVLDGNYIYKNKYITDCDKNISCINIKEIRHTKEQIKKIKDTKI